MNGSKICSIPMACGKASKDSARRRKMMVAVFEETEKVPKPDRHTSAIGSAHGAPIRVCKGRLTSACNPGVCNCPDETCKLKKTKMQILLAIIRVAIFGFAVEEAVRYGIWSDASKTDALTERYLSWAEEFFPTRKKAQRTPLELYDMARIKYNLKNVWNNTIVCLSSFISSIPERIAKAPDYFFPKKLPELVDGPQCELNKGIRDADD